MLVQAEISSVHPFTPNRVHIILPTPRTAQTFIKSFFKPRMVEYPMPNHLIHWWISRLQTIWPPLCSLVSSVSLCGCDATAFALSVGAETEFMWRQRYCKGNVRRGGTSFCKRHRKNSACLFDPRIYRALCDVNWVDLIIWDVNADKSGLAEDITKSYLTGSRSIIKTTEMQTGLWSCFGLAPLDRRNKLEPKVRVWQLPRPRLPKNF